MEKQSQSSVSAVGIIAEYNPFHNGHAYQLKKAKELSGADYCIAAISGDFVQRGGPAVFDKYTRAAMALDAGADLVVELPPVFASSSAEDFAACGVALLDAMGVSHLCFGSESGDLEELSAAADLLVEEPEEYQQALRQYLKEGYTFPQARAAALSSYDRNIDLELLNQPNNTLGIEYLKALKKRNSAITPITIKRMGSGYHEAAIFPDQPMASATAIRAVLEAQTAVIPNPPISKANPESLQSIISGGFGNSDNSSDSVQLLASQMPAAALELARTRTPLTVDDFSAILSFRLLELDRRGTDLGQFLDVSPELAQRIRRQVLDFSSISSRIQNLKTRQYTYTRISRSLFHILLNMTEDDTIRRKQRGYVSYIRVLGFRRESSALLSAIKKASALPLITKTADASKILSEHAFSDFQKDLYCSHLYQAVYQAKTGQALPNEYTHSVIIR